MFNSSSRRRIDDVKFTLKFKLAFCSSAKTVNLICYFIKCCKIELVKNPRKLICILICIKKMQGCLGKWNPCLLPGTNIIELVLTAHNNGKSRKHRSYSSKTRISTTGSCLMKNVFNHQTLGKSKHDYPGEIFEERKNLIWKEKQNLLYHFQVKSVKVLGNLHFTVP